MSNNTTHTTNPFISLDDAALATAMGGCKKKHCRCNNSNVVINNMAPPVPMPSPEPQVAT